MILALGVAAALGSGCIAVDGDRLTASHLAQADAIFASLPPSTAIGFSPRAGARRAFAAGELARIASRFGLSGKPAKGACFERVTDPLDRGRMLAAMAKTLANPEARIEIVEYSRYAAPRGEIEFPIEGLAVPPLTGPARGISRWRGFVRDSEGRKNSIWARVKIAAPVDLVIAAETLKPGEPIGAAQVKVERREVFSLRRTSVAGVEEALGRKPRRTLAAGTVIEASMLEQPHDVERGAKVETEVHSGGVVLKMDAVAETAGRRGETVMVKNPSSGKKFAARVEGKNKIVVRRAGL